MIGRDVEHVGDDGDRKRVGEVADEIDLTGEPSAVEKSFDRLLHRPEQGVDQRVEAAPTFSIAGTSPFINTPRTMVCSGGSLANVRSPSGRRRPRYLAAAARSAVRRGSLNAVTASS